MGPMADLTPAEREALIDVEGPIAPVAPVAPARKTRARKSDKQRAAFMAANTPAAAARVIGWDGKRFRNVLRSILGVYVSHGDTFDSKVKARMWDLTHKGAK